MNTNAGIFDLGRLFKAVQEYTQLLGIDPVGQQ
jgi:hypothetical protein